MMIEIKLTQTSRSGTAAGPALLHNRTEEVMFVGRTFDDDATYEVLVALNDSTVLLGPVTATISEDGVYASATLDMWNEDTEDALGTGQSVPVVIWLYNATAENYEGYGATTLKRSPEPSGITAVPGILATRFLQVDSIPASGRVDTVYYLPAADGGYDPGWYLTDGTGWVRFADKPT